MATDHPPSLSMMSSTTLVEDKGTGNEWFEGEEPGAGGKIVETEFCELFNLEIMLPRISRFARKASCGQAILVFLYMESSCEVNPSTSWRIPFIRRVIVPLSIIPRLSKSVVEIRISCEQQRNNRPSSRPEDTASSSKSGNRLKISVSITADS